MNKSLHWWHLLLLGIACKVAGYLLLDVYGAAIGMLGDLLFLIGVVGGIVKVINSRRKTPSGGESNVNPITPSVQHPTVAVKFRKLVSNKLILVIIFLLISNAYLLFRYLQFPVELVVCDRSYEECFVSARHSNLLSCETDSKRGNWLCDEGDPQRIECRDAGLESSAVSYCRN